MRGRERKRTGPERNDEIAPLLSFSTSDLPQVDRIAQWRDVMGRTLTGCSPSSLAGGELAVDFTMTAGETTRIAMTRLRNICNDRDRDCLRDQDGDLVFFSMLNGEGLLDHDDRRVRLRSGEGMLARFDRTIDTRWERADLMLIRLPRAALRDTDADRAVGRVQPASSTLMRLLQCYARAAWDDATRTGSLAPIADRHIAELVAALCASDTDAAERGVAAGPARLSAMREVMARGFADPCLTMRDVAEAVGVSERTGHLAFEGAGLSFTEELHAIRLERARERLLTTDARVLDVAFSVGFSDASHFYRLFKRRYTCSPTDMRRDRPRRSGSC